MTHILTRLPTAQEFCALRAETDWGAVTQATAYAALSASLLGALAVDGHKTLGMARVVGDGVLQVYIQDVVVCQSHRNTGIGRALIYSILDQIAALCPADCGIGLFAAEGQSGFYEEFGFKTRPADGFGPAMHARLSSLAKLDYAE